MDRVAVRSRDIAIVGYDDESLALEIVFRAGGVYRYGHVPREIYVGLMTAPSRGVFFDQAIKSKFPYQRIR